MKIRPLLGTMLFATMMSLLPTAGRAGSLGTNIIGLFPKEVGEFAYADLKKARQFKWFPQLKMQMLPGRFRQFEEFLASAGIDPNTQVEELAWGLVAAHSGKTEGENADISMGEQVVGVALGRFQPASTEAYFKSQKLPISKMRGFSLFAFGSSAGSEDLFFFFIDSNTAAFGHRKVLEKMIDVRFGAEEGLLRNDKFFSLINETNGQGVVWAVLNPAYAKLAVEQLVPEASQFPEARKLLGRLESLLISVEAGSGLEARFQAVCKTPEDANTFAALLQAGFLYRRYQETRSNPELAQLLGDARIAPRGDRLELRMALTDEQMASLIKNNTFSVKM